MNRQIEDISSIQKRIRCEIAPETVKHELSLAFDKIRRNRRIPGFRPGKAPRRILEARFGPQVREGVMQQLLQEAWPDVIEGLDIVGRPSVEPGEFDESGALAFTVTVDVRPEVSLGTYTGVEVEQPKVSVDDEHIDQLVQERLQQAAKVIEVEDRPVQEGDIVVLSLKLTDGDEVVVEEPGTSIFVGQDPYYPGVDTLLIGMSKDEEKSESVTIGDGAVQQSVQGRTLHADVKIVSVQVTEVPDLTDESATELGFEGGAVAMRESIANDVIESAKDNSRNQARANLLQKLIETHDFEVPSAMVESQLQQLVRELQMRQIYQGIDPKTMHMSDAQMAELRERSIFAVKGGLLLQAVAAAESIKVTQEDLNETLQEIADSQGQALEAVRSTFQDQGQLEELEHHVREKKTLDWLLEQAEVTEVAPESEEPAEG